MIASAVLVIPLTGRGACPDGTVDWGAGETCDDDNTVACDGCSPSCQNECGPGTCFVEPSAIVPGGPDVVVSGYVRNDSCASCDYSVNLYVTSPDLTLVSTTPSGSPVGSLGWGGPVAGGQQLDFTMTLRASSTMDGGVLHEYGVTNDGEYACTATAKACPIPSGETTTSNGWFSGEPRHGFRATLDPTSSSFLATPRRQVREKFFASEGTDTCWFDGSWYARFGEPVSNVNGWSVGGVAGYPNRWGIDQVGWREAEEGVIRFYRGDPGSFDTDNDGVPDSLDSSPAYDQLDSITVGPDGVPGTGDEAVAPSLMSSSCGWQFVQHMGILCPNFGPGSTEREYEFPPHPLSITIYPSEVGASRDGETPTNQAFP